MSQVAVLRRVRMQAMAVASAFALVSASTAVAEVKLDEAATIVGSTTQWDSFDPAATTVASLTGRWLSPVYDLLVNLNADGSFAPGLAVGWEFVKDGGADALVLRLRPGVKFHDGTVFNAEAVKANFDRNLASTRNIQTLIRTVESAKVVDPMTVSLKLKPGQGWLALWGLTMLPGRMMSPAAFSKAATHPVGTGPFVFQSMTPQTATFVRNESYWGPKPKYAKLVLQVVGSDNTSSINGVISGTVDIVSLVGPTEAELSQVRSAPGVKVELAPSGQFNFLSLDRSKPPFNDARVRQAVAHALDYDAIAKVLSYTPTRQMVSPQSIVYDEKRNSRYPRDLAKAKKLLADAGYPNGLDAGSIVVNQVGSLPRLAQIAQQQLGEIGIRTQLRLVDTAAQITQACVSGQCSLAAWALIQGQDPVYLAELMLLPPVNPSNPGGKAVTGPLADLLKQAELPATADEHTKIIRTLLDAMTEEAVSIYTGLDRHYVVYRVKVQNALEGWKNERHPDFSKLAATGR